MAQEKIYIDYQMLKVLLEKYIWIKCIIHEVQRRDILGGIYEYIKSLHKHTKLRIKIHAALRSSYKQQIWIRNKQ